MRELIRDKADLQIRNIALRDKVGHVRWPKTFISSFLDFPPLQLSNEQLGLSEQVQQLTAMLHSHSMRERQSAESSQAAETAMMHMAEEISRLHSKSLFGREPAIAKTAPAAATVSHSAAERIGSEDLSTPEACAAIASPKNASNHCKSHDNGTQTSESFQKGSTSTLDVVLEACGACASLKNDLKEMRVQYSKAITTHATALQKLIRGGQHKSRRLHEEDERRLCVLQDAVHKCKETQQAIVPEVRTHMGGMQIAVDEVMKTVSLLATQLKTSQAGRAQDSKASSEVVHSLKTQLEQSRTDYLHVKAQLEQKNAELGRLQNSVGLGEEQLQQARQSEVAATEAAQESSARAELLQTELQACVQRTESLERELDAKTNDCTAFVLQLDSARQEHNAELRRIKTEMEASAQAQVLSAIKASSKAISQLEATNRVLNDEIIDMKGRVRVICRLRPAASEAGGLAVVPHPRYSNKVLADDQSGTTATYEFDASCGPASSQKDVFQHVRPVVESCLNGNNVCLFAYGQTGAGKTYTMCGTDAEPGIIQQTVAHLFGCLDASPSTALKSAQMTALDIYNESLRDMLAPVGAAAAAHSLDIQTPRSASSSCVHGLSQHEVSNFSDFDGLFKQSRKLRSVGSHSMNKESSRSHLVVTLYLELLVSSGGKKEKTVCSKVQFIDLAGSERLSRTGAEGMTAIEAQSINASLSTLGLVMATLRKAKKKSTHVPYRNSKLTHLLQDSLAGSSKVIMIVNVAAETENAFESASTLEFGARCRAVELKAVKKKPTK